MLTFTDAVPTLVYEPWPMTMLSPGIPGTVKSCVPELVLDDGTLCGIAAGCVAARVAGSGAALVAGSGAALETSAAAECVLAGDAVGDADDAGVADTDAAGLADADAVARAAAAAELDALDPQAARPAPPMATAMMTAGTRHFNIPYPPFSNQSLQ
jgi:hypothetical protein